MISISTSPYTVQTRKHRASCNFAVDTPRIGPVDTFFLLKQNALLPLPWSEYPTSIDRQFLRWSNSSFISGFTTFSETTVFDALPVALNLSRASASYILNHIKNRENREKRDLSAFPLYEVIRWTYSRIHTRGCMTASISKDRNNLRFLVARIAKQGPTQLKVQSKTASNSPMLRLSRNSIPAQY
ncbi:hypothetical protein, variant [Coccidioides posadasii str. Silveira]|uniref:Uncharacterized protein n=1 Tax=Coccidioides posadasii (strain RMSCC 757 / Silveira) TaxID=443226 RepID=E9DDQ2_COCPS|nr:hypothetical protein, variant [Coccidioides posadasii str. Silveira]